MKKHLQTVNENYFQHMYQAGRFGFKFLLAAIVAFIHAIFPCWFERTASKMAKDISDEMSKRGDNG